jgi:hypothetical protein
LYQKKLNIFNYNISKDSPFAYKYTHISLTYHSLRIHIIFLFQTKSLVIMETTLKMFLMFVVFLVAITSAIANIEQDFGVVCCPDFKDLCVRPACYKLPYCCISLPSMKWYESLLFLLLFLFLHQSFCIWEKKQYIISNN